MTENRFWNLLAKKLSGEALPDELTELEQLIKAHPEWVYAAEHIENLWKLTVREDVYDSEVAFELHLEKNRKNGLHFPELDTPLTIEEFTQTPPPRRRRWLLPVAALVLLLGLASFWRFSAARPDGSIAAKKGFSGEVSTRLGSKSRLVLPDSTVVWLNAGSKLTYSDEFGVTDRNTTLVGEAFFDVRKSNIPFIIHAHTVQIKVMGTAFNVKSYPNEKTTETSLIRGRVEITLDRRPGEKFILKPNEKLVVANEMEEEAAGARARKKEPIVVLSGLTRSRNDDSIVETSWVDNKLVFQDESFAEIVRKLERWYDVHIDLADERLAGVRMTGTFENETVKQALTALQIASPFNFTMNQNNITITP